MFVTLALTIALLTIAMDPTAASTLHRQHHRKLPFEEVFQMLNATCNLDDYKCPKPKYLDPATHQWNKAALEESWIVQAIRQIEMSKKMAQKFLREEACCEEGECLEACSIFAKSDPDDATMKEVLDLKLPQFEKYRRPVEAFLKSQVNGSGKRKPAAVEEFLDAIYENRKVLGDMLQKSKLRFS